MRGETFVTRKITRAAAAIKAGLQDCLYLGNLDAKRDWGHARDFVEGMWLMLQQPTPDDYVLATGETHSVREFLDIAFGHAGIPVAWEGEGEQEVGRDRETGAIRVRVDPHYFRPTEVDLLQGDARKAAAKLGWRHKTKFNDLVTEMVDADIQLVEREKWRRDRSAR
jgi:GDPmannose 4,6-dehydratase